jgi:hypothetical protein
VTALIRYQAAVLLRAHRWVGPVLAYATLLAFVGDRQPLSDGLDWSAAALVPAAAWLTRNMLTAQPAPARACVAVAGGPHRAHLAALLTSLAAGAVLALAGTGYEVVRCALPTTPARLAAALAGGLATTLICLLVGSAVGTLCNPPLVRHPAVALLATIGLIVLALAADVSPANAALRGHGGLPASPGWVTGLPLLLAALLAALSWLASTLLAARRG